MPDHHSPSPSSGFDREHNMEFAHDPPNSSGSLQPSLLPSTSESIHLSAAQQNPSLQHTAAAHALVQLRTGSIFPHPSTHASESYSHSAHHANQAILDNLQRSPSTDASAGEESDREELNVSKFHASGSEHADKYFYDSEAKEVLLVDITLQTVMIARSQWAAARATGIRPTSLSHHFNRLREYSVQYQAQGGIAGLVEARCLDDGNVLAGTRRNVWIPWTEVDVSKLGWVQNKWRELEESLPDESKDEEARSGRVYGIGKFSHIDSVREELEQLVVVNTDNQTVIFSSTQQPQGTGLKQQRVSKFFARSGKNVYGCKDPLTKNNLQMKYMDSDVLPSKIKLDTWIPITEAGQMDLSWVDWNAKFQLHERISESRVVLVYPSNKQVIYGSNVNKAATISDVPRSQFKHLKGLDAESYTFKLSNAGKGKGAETIPAGTTLQVKWLGSDDVSSESEWNKWLDVEDPDDPKWSWVNWNPPKPDPTKSKISTHTIVVVRPKTCQAFYASTASIVKQCIGVSRYNLSQLEISANGYKMCKATKQAEGLNSMGATEIVPKDEVLEMKLLEDSDAQNKAKDQ